jgi:hypothetical protein
MVCPPPPTSTVEDEHDRDLGCVWVFVLDDVEYALNAFSRLTRAMARRGPAVQRQLHPLVPKDMRNHKIGEMIARSEGRDGVETGADISPAPPRIFSWYAPWTLPQNARAMARR